MTTWEKYLQELYYDPKHSASFGGKEKLFQAAKQEGRHDVTRARIKKFLREQETYSLHHSVNRQFKRNKVMTTGIDDQWEMDLMDMVSYARENNNVHYVLLVIDVFSKYIWLRPLQNKSGPVVKQAIEAVLNGPRKPSRVRTDKGQEFWAKVVQQYFKSEGITHFTSQNELKANIAERAIKTVKAKIQRYMTYNQTFKYINHLQDFATSYNKSIHGSIKMAPNDVSEDDEVTIWKRLHWPTSTELVKRPHFKYNVGDNVRLTYLRHAFHREYDQNWTGEVFKITRRYIRGGLPIYTIKDFNEKDIEGTFYQNELQKVFIKGDQLWKIDKILKQRKRKGKTEYFVKWLYWPKTFNSWVDNVVDI
jgi:hypothetical protein